MSNTTLSAEQIKTLLETVKTADEAKVGANLMWAILGGCLVFFM